MIVIDQQLTKLRKKNNMSQEKLAELLGVSRQTIYKWENNKAYPDMINLVTLSDIFDISMEELIKGVQKDNLDESKTACNQTLNQIKTRKTNYEYKSEKHIGNLPLIHINLGMKNCKAKGIIAIGNVSMGLISIGLVSVGFLAIGLLSLAIIASGFCGIGVISISVMAIGIYTLGAMSLGVFL